MTSPDPEGQPDRRRVWVDKTCVAKPPAMGMTIADTGCSFDFTPPTAPESSKPGRKPAKLDACKTWLAERLAMPARVRDVRDDAESAGYSASTLYVARDALGVIEDTIDGRKWWRISGDTDG
jgi:hypothetical protein